MSTDWDQLHITWDDFHPDARVVVPDPRLWDHAYDFSPNGNDSGHDVLSAFVEDGVASSSDGGKAFCSAIFRGWGVKRGAKPGDDDYRHKRLMIFGMAFAYLKCAAYCPNWLANEAIRQVDEFKEYIERVDPEWDLKAECYSYYDSMKSCLTDCPRRPPEDPDG